MAGEVGGEETEEGRGDRIGGEGRGCTLCFGY